MKWLSKTCSEIKFIAERQTGNREFYCSDDQVHSEQFYSFI